MNDVTPRSAGAPPRELYRSVFLVFLVLVYATSFLARLAPAVIGPSMVIDMHLSDAQFGLLSGLAFSIFYSLLGMPIGRLADRVHRVTLISVSIILYSVLTMLSGWAGSYWQLLLLRLGVGIGEAGGTPTAHSLISDLYGPRRRATALSVYALGPPIGILLLAFGGGFLMTHGAQGAHGTHGALWHMLFDNGFWHWLFDTFGTKGPVNAGDWRIVFKVFGIPGIVIGILAWITLREPKRGAMDEGANTHTMPSMRDVLRTMLSNRAVVQILLGVVVGAFVQYGVNMFIPMYLIRVYDLTPGMATGLFGLVVGGGGIVGNLLGGLSADWASQRDHRWYAWVSAFSTLLGFPLMAIGLWYTGGWMVSVALLLLATILLSMWNGPSFAVLFSVAGLRMRATASAITFLLMNLVGQGLGPTTIGFLSGKISASQFTEGNFGALCMAPKGAHGAAAVLHGPFASACHDASAHGVRYAMLIVSVLLVWSAIHYFLAARYLRSNEPNSKA